MAYSQSLFDRVTTQVRTMTEKNITIDGNWNDIEMQVREMETAELIRLCKMMQQNPTPYQMVSDELTWRMEAEQKIESGQIEQIAELGLTR